MISKEVIFDRLQKMNPSEVASIVRNALIEADIENDPEISGIYFESLLSNSSLPEDYIFAFSAERYSENVGSKKYLGADTRLNDEHAFEFDSSFLGIIPGNESIAPVAA